MPVSTALLIASAVLVLAIALGLLVRRLDGRRRAGGTALVSTADLPSGISAPITLVQFSTELCARCPQVRRMLHEIAASSGVAQAEIDLTRRSDLATKYHVLQTPTTFLVDASGNVAARWGGVPERASITDAIAALRAATGATRQKQDQS